MSIIKRLKWKDKSGKTTDYDLGAKASNVEQDATHRFVSDMEKQTWNGKADPGDIPSGAAADYGVANNDTTNRADMLSTAQVAYRHGKEIDQLNSERLKFISSTRVVVNRSSVNSGQQVENISVSYEVPEGTKLVVPVFGGCNWGNIVSSQLEDLLSGSFTVSAINLSSENHTLVIVFNIYFFG